MIAYAERVTSKIVARLFIGNVSSFCIFDLEILKLETFPVFNSPLPGVIMFSVISWKDCSLENPYILPDYPYGFNLRCKKRIWVEKAKKGAGKGDFRVVSQTTNPKASSETWNKPKAGIYHNLAILYIDPPTGYIEIAVLQVTDLMAFKEFYYKFWETMDIQQKSRYAMMAKMNYKHYPASWKDYTDIIDNVTRPVAPVVL